MNKVMIALLILLTLSLLDTACSKGRQSRETGHSLEASNRSVEPDDKFGKMKKYLMHKKITTLNKILNTPESKTDTRILCSYTGFDCSSCVETYFQLINGLTEKDKQRLVIIATSSSVGNDQLRYNYDQLIYSDTNDLLRKELK